MSDEKHLWKGVAGALGFEPREEAQLHGLSGHTHHFSGLALDEINRRLLVCSSELDPRMAAMVHADVSAHLSDYKLITVRPLTFDISQLANLIKMATGKLEFDGASTLAAFQKWSEENAAPSLKGSTVQEALSAFQTQLGAAANVLMPFLRAATLSGLSPAEQIILLVRELTILDWPSLFKGINQEPKFNIASLAHHDAQRWDREYGLCPLPLYELQEDDWEIFKIGTDKDVIKARLSAKGVSQYFNPPKDHAALAVIDRGITKEKSVAAAVLTLPEIGHPISENEFLGNSEDLIHTIHELGKIGYVVEGDMGLTVTEAGKEFRAGVKFRPREGVFSKLINKINLNLGISPKDFI